MNLNEAKQLLNDNGYAIDEGIGNFVKKARRAVFGKNKDDEDKMNQVNSGHAYKMH